MLIARRNARLILVTAWSILAASVAAGQAFDQRQTADESPTGLIAAFSELFEPVVRYDRLPPDPFSKGSWAVDAFGFATTNIADEQEQANFVGGGIGVGYYIADGLAVRGEFIGLGADQEGDDATTGGFNLLGRWHFYRQDRWSFFAEGGGGLLFSDVSIPDGSRRSGDDDGTNFNFTLHAGVGTTYHLWNNAHLTGGFRYMHISNARIKGVDRNPSNDTIGGYFGIMFTF